MVDHTIITLLTDFGFQDSFVAQMKGAILNLNPHVNIIDISHSIKSYDIRQAAVTLGMCYKYFPENTIHLAVVDPGVGSNRRPIIVKTDKYCFVGPDNGIFSIVYQENKDNLEVYHITASSFFLKTESSTFHGRDIFAPIAAWLSKGISFDKFGLRIDDFFKFSTPEAEIISNDLVKGEILYIDYFGNAISSINVKTLNKLNKMPSEEKFSIVYNGKDIPLKRYYSEVEDKELYSLLNSSGYIEIFVYRGDAANRFNINIGDTIDLKIKD